jgi:hypothetical protein
MPSAALAALLQALPEVNDLLAAGGPSLPLRNTAMTRATRRASTVALSSHYERYLYSLNEEAVTAINTAGIAGDALPEVLRLYHTKPAVELLSQTAWERSGRARALEGFIQEEAWLWVGGKAGTLSHGRLLEFMKAPKPDAVRRYFGYWGIDDIFATITRTPHVRTKLYVKLVELVDKRNAIAHGDASIVPTYNDVISYRGVVRTFCERTDGAMAKHLAVLTQSPEPW